jgi:BirA family biotin operon repressor/biotin-[acetyl-CoA-carboxylase] ligase
LISADDIRDRAGVECLLWRAVTASTNDWALSAAQDFPDVPALFLAEIQTAGRGQGMRTWTSGQGALTFSLLVHRPLPLEHPSAGLLAPGVAEAICRCVEPIAGTRAWLKWPNDVYVQDAKLAGVLIESAANDRLVIGCGLNVTNPISGVDDAISLAQVMPRPPAPTDLAAQLARSILDVCAELQTASSALLERCRSRDWLAGKPVIWTFAQGERAGTVRTIADNGGLELFLAGESVLRIIVSGSVRPVGRSTPAE